MSPFFRSGQFVLYKQYPDSQLGKVNSHFHSNCYATCSTSYRSENMWILALQCCHFYQYFYCLCLVRAGIFSRVCFRASFPLLWLLQSLYPVSTHVSWSTDKELCCWCTYFEWGLLILSSLHCVRCSFLLCSLFPVLRHFFDDGQ